MVYERPDMVQLEAIIKYFTEEQDCYKRRITLFLACNYTQQIPGRWFPRPLQEGAAGGLRAAPRGTS